MEPPVVEDVAHTMQAGDDDHDAVFTPASGVRTHPIIFDAHEGRIYKGGPGQYHVTMIDRHPPLRERIPNYWTIGSGLYHGRYNTDDTVSWYKYPPDALRTVAEQQLGGASSDPTWDDHDWADEPQSPEQPRNVENIWKNSLSLYADFLKAKTRIVPCPWGRNRTPVKDFEKRVPFRFNVRNNTVYLGEPGMFHAHIKDSPNWEGAHLLDLHDGYIWTHRNAVDWYEDGMTKATPEQQEAVQEALSEHLGVPLQRQNEEDYATDEFWQDA
jgi:hypothetical protein